MNQLTQQPSACADLTSAKMGPEWIKFIHSGPISCCPNEAIALIDRMQLLKPRQDQGFVDRVG